MPVYEYEGVRPVVDPTAFVHPTAVLLGDVRIGAKCFIGPGAVLRGDIAAIIVGAGSNVQDNCIIHSFPGQTVILEENAHIGHGAIIHGCHIGRNAMIGMNAVIMDGAQIGEEAIVGALAFVKAKMVVERRKLVAGLPARAIRTVSDEEISWKEAGTLGYQHIAERSHATLKEVEALTEIEPNRPELPTWEHRPKGE